MKNISKQVEQLIVRAHAIAKSKGWWDKERSIEDVGCNIHGELSEAWEEYRKGRMDLWFSDGSGAIYKPEQDCNPFDFAKDGLKPEGFWIEIADAAIRTADLVGKIVNAYDFPHLDDESHSLGDGVMTISAWVALIHWTVSNLVTDEDQLGYAIAVIAACDIFARCHGQDLLGDNGLCALKMTYNATRPYRHGNKIA